MVAPFASIVSVYRIVCARFSRHAESYATMPLVPSHQWEARFADRAAHIHLTAVSGPTAPPSTAPDYISLRSGAPAPECVPFEWLEEGAQRAWKAGPSLSGYAAATGSEPLRAAVAALMRARGCEDVTPEHITLLTGAQQGLDCIARLFLDPGDTVAIDDPAYPGAIQVFDLCQPRYLPVPITADGMDLDALEALLAGGARPKFLYTVPTFQNPTGATLPPAGRERLVALSRQYGLLIVEDDPYGELAFDGPPIAPIRALDADVLYVGTFSKTIAPGIRTGWIVTPPALWDKMYALKEAMDINSDRFMQETVAGALATGFYPGHVAHICETYRERRDLMLDALHEYMPPDVQWNTPAGGFFVWLRLPVGMNAADVDVAARAHNVGVVLGSGCTVVPAQHTDSIRLSFCSTLPTAIPRGIRRLAAAIATVRE